MLACQEGRFDDVNAHCEATKQHIVNNAYTSTVAMTLQAHILRCQGKLTEVVSQYSHAVGAFVELGSTVEADDYRKPISKIRAEMNGPALSDEPALNSLDGELRS